MEPTLVKCNVCDHSYQDDPLLTEAKCPRCGSDNPVPMTSGVMKCHHCGGRLPADATFCSNCFRFLVEQKPQEPESMPAPKLPEPVAVIMPMPFDWGRCIAWSLPIVVLIAGAVAIARVERAERQSVPLCDFGGAAQELSRQELADFRRGIRDQTERYYRDNLASKRRSRLEHDKLESPSDIERLRRQQEDYHDLEEYRRKMEEK